MMSTAFSLEQEPFEFELDSEFAEDFGSEDEGEFDQASESKAGNSKWEEEFRRGSRFPSRGTPRLRQPVRPGAHRLRLARRTGAIRPRVIGGAASCTCPTHDAEYVRWVQSSLNKLFGRLLPVTGIMTPATRRVLKQFQKQQGLTADGIAGPDTERALIEAKTGKSAQGAAGDFDLEAETERETTGLPTIAPVPTPGHYYQIKKGDFLLKVAERAYPGERYAGAKRINADPLNWKFVRREEKDNLFPQGKISFLPRYTCDASAQIESTGQVPRGNCYGVIWIPSAGEPTQPEDPDQPKPVRPPKRLKPLRPPGNKNIVLVKTRCCKTEHLRDIHAEIRRAAKATRLASERFRQLASMPGAERAESWNNGQEKIWFGSYNRGTRNLPFEFVRKTIEQIRRIFLSKRLVVQCYYVNVVSEENPPDDCISKPCDNPAELAVSYVKGRRDYLHPMRNALQTPPYIIYLTNGWFCLPKKGDLEEWHKRKSTTIVHEVAHLAGARRTKFLDEVYGEESAKKLARRNAWGARVNAENYAYYMMSLLLV